MLVFLNKANQKTKTKIECLCNSTDTKLFSHLIGRKSFLIAAVICQKQNQAVDPFFFLLLLNAYLKWKRIAMCHLTGEL